MRIKLIAVGTKMPVWVNQGVEEYTKRLPREWAFKIAEVPLAKRPKNYSPAVVQASESKHVAEVLDSKARSVVLDVTGKAVSTEQLAQQLQKWQEDARDVEILVGGPDGFTRDFVTSCDQRLSLSALTLPHPLVRLLLAEQLYRAWSVNAGHPYHRA